MSKISPSGLVVPLAKEPEKIAKEASLAQATPLEIMDGNHFARRNQSGYLDIIDSRTGNRVAMLSRTPVGGVLPAVAQYSSPTGEMILLDAAIDPNTLSHIRPTKYDPFVVDLVCQRVANGEALSTICQDPDMPTYSTLMSWRRAHSKVEEQLAIAREERAERRVDEALEIAMKNEDFKFPTQAAKLKVETLMQVAAFENKRYAPKTKVEATVNMPTQIIVQTGIDRTIPVEEVAKATIQVSATPLDTPAAEITTPLSETGEF